MRTIFIFLIINILTPLSNLFAQTDTLYLSLRDVYEKVLEGHPIAKQANLLPQEAIQELRLAKGMFDPKIVSQFNGKEFKDKNYYRHWNNQLKVPTWWGPDFKFGYERNTGVNLSTENDTDKGNGLAYAGIEFPLGQGLVIDQRRAAILQAEIYQKVADAEKIKIINKLVLQIAKDYWAWYYHHFKYITLQKGLTLAQRRYDLIVIGVEQGDYAPIDSVEAQINLQQRVIDLQNANVELQNARLLFSNHFWGENGEPLEITEQFVPKESLDYLPIEKLEDLFEYAKENHPELLKLQNKLLQLEIDRKLAREMLKPQIDLKYNLLARNPLNSNDFGSTMMSENYKFGLDFSFPIFLRKERSKLQKTKLKINQLTFERDFLNRDLLNQIAANYNDARNLQSVLVIQESMVNNYRILFAGEVQKFQNGESSVFYVNVRESKLLETEVKFYEMQQKYAKSLAELRWSAGKGWE
jgi:outer membrane protein TolC